MAMRKRVAEGQLDLFAQTQPEQPAPALNRHAIAWYQGQADFYLSLINRFSALAIAHPEVTRYRHEINLLIQKRKAALQKLSG